MRLLPVCSHRVGTGVWIWIEHDADAKRVQQLHQLADAYDCRIALDFGDSSLIESDLRTQLCLSHSPGFTQGPEMCGQLGGRLENQLFHECMICLLRHQCN